MSSLRITGRHKTERFLLFAMLVAGKRSDVQRQKLNDFLTQGVMGPNGPLMPSAEDGPFGWIRILDDAGLLEDVCRQHKLGKYQLIVPGFRKAAREAERGDFDPTDTSLQELRSVPGIGPKTARFFLLRTDPNARVASLDTHVLSFLKEQGVKDVPDETPNPGPQYQRLETRFVEEADARSMSPLELDTRVWAEKTASELSPTDREILNQFDNPDEPSSPKTERELREDRGPERSAEARKRAA